MRTVQLDTDVFAKIWAHRTEGEETENEILRRLLGSARQERALDAGAKRPSVPVGVPPTRGRIRWRDDVMQALVDLGGAATLDEIYRKVRSIRRAAGRSLPPSTDAVIRRELENNSSDSEAFTRERDWFEMPQGKGAGIWSIRTGAKRSS
jgi:hypothetical protein